MVFCPIGIVAELLDIRCVIPVGRSNRVIIANHAVAEQDLVDRFLPIDGVFESLSQFQVVEWRTFGQHREGVVQGPSAFFNNDTRLAGHQRQGLELHTIDTVHFACDQCVLAGNRICDGMNFNRIRMCRAVLPVVGIAFEFVRPAGLFGRQDIAARSA